MSIKIIYLLAFLLVMSCTGYQTISYRWGNSKIKYRMDVPKGYSFEEFGGDHESEKRFWYRDSSVVYITDFTNTINYDEIRQQGTYSRWLIAGFDDDTLTLSGIDSLGLLWKDRKLKRVIVGYHAVASADKALFEKAIYSVRQK